MSPRCRATHLRLNQCCPCVTRKLSGRWWWTSTRRLSHDVAVIDNCHWPLNAFPMTAGMKARYDSTAWSRRSGASREWVLEVEEPGLGGGAVGAGQLLPDELLSVRDSLVPITPEQRTA